MSAENPWFRREGLALLTDLYELAMAAGYCREGREDQRVCFEYFFRSLPPDSGYAVTAGLEPFLDYLEHLRFDESDIGYLRSLDLFDEDFFVFLASFTPDCTVRAMPEGTLAFPHEPIVQVEGPIAVGQLVETALLNILNYQTLLATKAARICIAAEGDPVLEFGLRRAHGPDGGVSGSRACYIGGCASTSNVLAGKIYGIPASGTHAHSWVMSFESELDAFRAFARNYPQKCVLLVDTYDTIESGVPNAIEVYKEMREAGHDIRPAIRLDSGDLAKLSKEAHRMMAAAGFDDPLIVASNDLEEDLIADLKRQGAKINAWGVGTHLITARDCPSLSGVYKLVSVWDGRDWLPRMKTTSNIGKSTDPGRKQVVRYYGEDGAPLGDVLYVLGDAYEACGDITGHLRIHHHLHRRLRGAVNAQPLLETVFENGRKTHVGPDLSGIRQKAQEQIARLPDEYKRLRNPEIYKVLLSERVADMKTKFIEDQDA